MNPTYFLGMIIGVGIRLVVVNEWFMGAISMWRIADLLLRDLQKEDNEHRIKALNRRKAFL